MEGRDSQEAQLSLNLLMWGRTAMFLTTGYYRGRMMTEGSAAPCSLPNTPKHTSSLKTSHTIEAFTSLIKMSPRTRYIKTSTAVNTSPVPATNIISHRHYMLFIFLLNAFIYRLQQRQMHLLWFTSYSVWKKKWDEHTIYFYLCFKP